MKLLICDDDQNFCRILRTVLEGDGHELVIATSAQESARAIRASRFDVVLLASHPPAHEGISFLSAMRRTPNGADSVTVLMSAQHDEALRRAAIDHRVEQVIVRPFSVLDLAQLVRGIRLRESAPAAAAVAPPLALDNLEEVVRIWARRADGILKVQHGTGEVWVRIVAGGIVETAMLEPVRESLYGGDMEFIPSQVSGVGDPRAMAELLWRAALDDVRGRPSEPSRGSILSRTRLSDAVGRLPIPDGVRNLVDSLSTPVTLGMAADHAGLEARALTDSLAALALLGMISVAAPPTPVRIPSVAPPERVYQRRPIEPVRSPVAVPTARAGTTSASAATSASTATSGGKATDPRSGSGGGHASAAAALGEATRRSLVQTPRSSGVARSVFDAAEHTALLKRMRRELELLRGSDPWVVLGVPHDAAQDLVVRAGQRMLARYESIRQENEGEARQLAQQLLERIRHAIAELEAASAAAPPARAQPGDAAFQAGLRAMSEGDWPLADRRFSEARDQNLDSPRNLAHQGWARVHNPDFGNAERVEEGLDILLLAEQLDPSYPEGQYFLAMVLHRKGDDDGAMRRLRRALKSEPGHVAANALMRKLRTAALPAR